MRNSPLSKVNEIGHLVTSEFQFNYNHGCPALEVELGRQQRIQMVFCHLIISEQPPKPLLSIRFQPYSQFSPHFQFVHLWRSIQSHLNVNVLSSNLSFEKQNSDLPYSDERAARVVAHLAGRNSPPLSSETIHVSLRTSPVANSVEFPIVMGIWPAHWPPYSSEQTLAIATQSHPWSVEVQVNRSGQMWIVNCVQGIRQVRIYLHTIVCASTLYQLLRLTNFEMTLDSNPRRMRLSWFSPLACGVQSNTAQCRVLC